MKRAFLTALAVSTVCAVSGFAQGRDFSGSWTVDVEKTMANQPAAVRSAAGGGGGGVGGMRSGGGGGAVVASGAEVRTTAGGGGGVGGGGGAVARGGGGGGGRGGGGPIAIAIDSTSFTVSNGSAPAVAYKLDNSSSTTHNERGDVVTKSGWNGDKFVITSTLTTSAGVTSTTTTSWYLDGGSLVRELSTQAASGDPNVSKTYFKHAE